ncbi:MAG: NAD(P)/FAD-dependent oxidoreductase [Nitrospinota bacterium]|nr:NAD(P)/FAD-dependent oxidoreductase [Nitrospinota bacterium]
MKKLLILGAGTGGTIIANQLSKKLDPKKWSITMIDKASEHYYQPGFLFLPFKLYGYETRADVTKPITKPLPKGVTFLNEEIKLIDHENNRVETDKGVHDYDWMILALGTHVAPSEIEGMEEAFGEHANTFYTLDGALSLQKSFENFKGGRVVLNIAEMPIKCPVAPIEFVFLADYYFHKRNMRDKVEIDLVTPLTGAFTKPEATRVLNEIAAEKNIKIIPNFTIGRVDGKSKTIFSFTGESVPYDLLVSIPPNLGPEVIEDSGLGNGAGFALTDKHTLKSQKADNIYVLGDNTNVPTSKAGSVAHFEAEIIVENFLRELKGEKPLPDYDGHSNCFIESGFHKALLFDFNYDTEPLAGTFPVPGVGPFSLLKESHLNHLGKMGFKWVYWNMLLTGHLPGDPLLPAQMSRYGKDFSPHAEDAGVK